MKKLANIKKALQGDYDKNVRALRNESFAHRSLTATSEGTTVQLMTKLADGARGIYEDVWEAYHNARPFLLQEKKFNDDRGLEQDIERYFQLYSTVAVSEQ